MYAVSFFKRVVNIPRSLCLVAGGVMSGALYLGGVMTVNPTDEIGKQRKMALDKRSTFPRQNNAVRISEDVSGV